MGSNYKDHGRVRDRSGKSHGVKRDRAGNTYGSTSGWFGDHTTGVGKSKNGAAARNKVRSHFNRKK